MLIARLFWLQVVRHDYFVDLAQGNRVRIEPIPAARGLILDRNGAPLYTNAAAQALFGVSDAVDLVRDPMIRGLMQTIRDQVPRELLESSTTSKWSGEVGFRGSDGLERTLHVDLVIQRNADGTIEYWGGVARDVTDRNHMQSELLRQANTPTTPASTIDALRRVNDMVEGTRLPKIPVEKIEAMIHREALPLLGLE